MYICIYSFNKEKAGTAARLHAQWREDFPSSLEHLDYADEVQGHLAYKKPPPLGPYSKTMPGALWGS